MSHSIYSNKIAQLLNIARHTNNKQAFVDPAMMAGGGAPPMDPAMAGGGGAPTMDPAMMGGAPPMDPAMAGGGGGAPPGVTADEVRSIVQEAMAGMGGAGGAAGDGMLKPKIDVNVEIMQMKNMMAKIVDALGIPIPAQEMSATPEKLTAMAQGGDPNAAGGGAPGGGSAISPIEPMGAASPEMAQGKMASSQGMNTLSDRAAAMAAVLARRNSD